MRWSEEAPIESRTVASTWLAPRGHESLWGGLCAAGLRYAATGSVVGAVLAPVAPTRLASLYVEEPAAVAQRLGLREAELGANVVLLQPDDEAVFERVDERNKITCAMLPLVAADLLSGPGRSPAEAEALMDWMATHEEDWRG